MEPPQSLPARLYLLMYNLKAERLTSRGEIGYALRAAALADLLIEGRLADDSGKPVAVKDTGRPADPVLDGMLRRIEGSRPRSWQHWIRKGPPWDSRAVRDQLADGGWIRVEKRKVLGVFPGTRITVREPRMVKQLSAAVAGALRGTQPVARVDRRDAALVALATAGELNHVLDRRKRRTHKERIAQLTAAAGPVPPALRRVIRQAHSARASG